MQMATTRTNYPKEILEFIQAITMAIKDPKTLQPLVEAAEAVGDAHQLTAAQEAAYNTALQTIEDAAQARKALEDTLDGIAKDKDSIAKDKAELLAREQRNESRTQELDRQYAALAETQAEHARYKTAVENKAKDLARVGNEQTNLASTLATREALVTKREQKLAAASKLVSADE